MLTLNFGKVQGVQINNQCYLNVSPLSCCKSVLPDTGLKDTIEYKCWGRNRGVSMSKTSCAIRLKANVMLGAIRCTDQPSCSPNYLLLIYQVNQFVDKTSSGFGRGNDLLIFIEEPSSTKSTDGLVLGSVQLPYVYNSTQVSLLTAFPRWKPR